MKRLHGISLFLAALLLTSSSQILLGVHGETKDASYFIKSTMQYSNLSQNRVWNLTARTDYRTISLFMNNTWQTVEFVNSTSMVESIENDEDGNPVAVLQLPKSVLNPSENVSFTVWYHIVSKPRIMPNILEDASGDLRDIPQSLVDEYTREEGSWQTRNQALVSLALLLKGSETKALTIIKNFVKWINEHIRYPSLQALHEIPYYPNETYAQREGDCDDQAILLVTLARIVGIPSFLQIGSIYLPTYFNETSMWNGTLSIVERRIGWHGWAVVYIPPWGWLPVDLTYVYGGFDDPLNSIKHAAVTSQDTIQYMNATHMDYVYSSLEAREFLIKNEFHVYMEDEMIQEVEQDANLFPIIVIDPWVSFALIVLTTFALVFSYLFFTRWRRRRTEQTLTSSARPL